MTDRDDATLIRTLDLHKRLTRASSVSLLRAAGKSILRVTSSSPSGLVLRSAVAATGDAIDTQVDLAALSAFARGSRDRDVEMSVRDGRLHVRAGRTRGDIPALSEDQPEVPVADASTQLESRDVKWLCEGLPRVQVSDLDRNGLLSAACDGREWQLSCTDDIHGACLFGPGRSRAAFSLAPADADVLRSLLESSRYESGDVRIGHASGSLLVRTEQHLAAIPSVDGKPQERDRVVKGTRAVAAVDAAELRDALATLAPVATAKDANPVTIKLMRRGIELSVSSPAGSIRSALSAKVDSEVEFRVSYLLLAALAPRAEGRVALCTLTEGREVARLTMRCGDLYLICLTST